MAGQKPKVPLLTWFREGIARSKVGSQGVADRLPVYAQLSHHSARLLGTSSIDFFNTGLFTLAANLLGFQHLLMAILSDPDGVHRLMRFLPHEIVAPWIVCQRQHCGSEETATGSDALASPPLISSQMIRLFINDIPYDPPPENVRAVVSVAREYRANATHTRYVRQPDNTSKDRWPTMEEACRQVASLVTSSPR